MRVLPLAAALLGFCPPAAAQDPFPGDLPGEESEPVALALLP